MTKDERDDRLAFWGAVVWIALCGMIGLLGALVGIT